MLSGATWKKKQNMVAQETTIKKFNFEPCSEVGKMKVLQKSYNYTWNFFIHEPKLLI